MARTLRANKAERDGYKTQKAKDRAPPHWFRRDEGTKPTRRLSRAVERAARLGRDEPATQAVRLPHYT